MGGVNRGQVYTLVTVMGDAVVVEKVEEADIHSSSFGIGEMPTLLLPPAHQELEISPDKK